MAIDNNQKSRVYKTLLRIMYSLRIPAASSEKNFYIRTSDGRELLAVTPHSLRGPVAVASRLLTHPSPLRDVKPDDHDISRLGTVLEEKRAVIRLNHIGFCYKVASQQTERQRLMAEAQKKNWHVYEEPSVNEGLWLFVGNTESWKNPLLEFIPVAETKNRWATYWLPHIQIDLDTSLSEKEVKEILHSVFGRKAHSHTTAIDGIVYFVSVWLGIVGGVNFELDIGTNSRNTRYARQHILHRLV